MMPKRVLLILITLFYGVQSSDIKLFVGALAILYTYNALKTSPNRITCYTKFRFNFDALARPSKKVINSNLWVPTLI